MNLFLSIVATLFLLGCIPQNVSGVDFSKGSVRLTNHLTDGSLVEVVVQKENLGTQYPYRHAFIWGGDESLMPKTVITALRIEIGTNSIVTPLSAYSNLGDPRLVSLEKMQSGFKIIIVGGDAAGSYEAVLLYSMDHILNRKVVHGEFPSEVWEETVCSFITKNSDR